MKVKMSIYAGGAWEGHVVFRATHPIDNNSVSVSSDYNSVKNFCEEYFLETDEAFETLVKKHLVFSNKYGLTIPVNFIDEFSPISSANKYLKDNFPDYYN